MTSLTGILFSKIYLSFMEYIFTSTQNGVTFDSTELKTLQIRNENSIGFLFYLYNFTVNFSVKNMVSACEYMNVKHRNDAGYVKMET